MAKLLITKTTKKKKRKSKVKNCPTCGKFMGKKQVVNMTPFDFTKEEVKEIKSKIYLTKLQEKIFDMKMERELTEDGMALVLNVSKSTIYYQWRKVRKKILKVI